MKTLITIITSLCLGILHAQTPYEKGMQKAFELWKSHKSDEAINLFERIAKAENDNWIPYYYAAQAQVVQCFMTKDGKEIDLRLKKAQDYLNQAKTFSKENAEIYVVEALLNTAWVAHDPKTYGATLSPKIEALYQKAKGLDSNNPRAILLHAEWQMGAAKFWGKDPKTFCPEIEKAILYLENEKTDIPFYPSWGIRDVARIQKNCSQSE